MAETTTPRTTSTSTKTAATSAAEKAAATRKRNAAKRSTAAKKAAETRAANRGAAARKEAVKSTRTAARKTAAAAKQEVRTPISRATGLAEKAVYVPVGAALVAREELAETIGALRSTYSTRKKTENELRRYERRGAAAVKRVERELKQGRTRFERPVKSVIDRSEPVTARIENVVQGGRTAATQASSKVQERIATLA